MTADTTVLLTDMAILVGIFLLGFLAKIFPKNGGRGIRDQGLFTSHYSLSTVHCSLTTDHCSLTTDH